MLALLSWSVAYATDKGHRNSRLRKSRLKGGDSDKELASDPIRRPAAIMLKQRVGYGKR